MSRPEIHAIDGGMFDHALCEEPTGDRALDEVDVTCGECLDLVEQASPGLLHRMRLRGWTPLVIPSWERIPCEPTYPTHR